MKKENKFYSTSNYRIRDRLARTSILATPEPYVFYYVRQCLDKEIKKINLIHKPNHPDIQKRDSLYVEGKTRIYMSAVAAYLQQEVVSSKSVRFWRKSLEMGLSRTVALAYSSFKLNKEHFDPDSYNYELLDESGYYLPQTFDDLRDFYQSTAYGQEQLFSIYVRTFFPGRGKFYNDAFSWPDDVKKSDGFMQLLRRATVEKVLLRLLTSILNLFAPKILIFGSYFSDKNKLLLLLKGRGRIAFNEKIPSLCGSSGHDKAIRIRLLENLPNYDEFDLYFMEVCKYSFPSAYLEAINKNISIFERFVEQNAKKISYCVNESWIGNSSEALLCALLQEGMVKHIYNEHNFLQYFFLGNSLKRISSLVDMFVTIGWHGTEKNMLHGSTLRKWVSTKKPLSQSSRILYVCGPPVVKSPEKSGSYGGFGADNAILKINFLTDFFSRLSGNVLSKIHFRDYNVSDYLVSKLDPPFVCYDVKSILIDFVEKFGSVDDFRLPLIDLMQSSRLIIVDYLSTSYIEALLANKPTIFFFYTESYLLDESHQNVFDGLIEVGICHTSPTSAAEFVNENYAEIEEWWSCADVQYQRRRFLDANINTNKDLINIIAGLLSQP